ncbi:hypothetical protein [Burkholderia ubonensis]|uniref:hypothetical protein n=1 Tax=Burkholderia ubonensis TaxID=101571 RepID=UPI000A60E777|nr:hypothetical protein [Burkholderia ubonensis]
MIVTVLMTAAREHAAGHPVEHGMLLCQQCVDCVPFDPFVRLHNQNGRNAMH